MSCRGKGTLEIRQSNNPFYQTSANSMYLAAQADALGRRKEQQAPEEKVVADSEQAKICAFRFRNTNGDYGGDLKSEGSHISDAMDKITAARSLVHKGLQRRPKVVPPVTSGSKCASPPKHNSTPGGLPQHFKHISVEQHPIYTTSSAVIGQKPPGQVDGPGYYQYPKKSGISTTATIPYRNNGLNTSCPAHPVNDKLLYGN